MPSPGGLWVTRESGRAPAEAPARCEDGHSGDAPSRFAGGDDAAQGEQGRGERDDEPNDTGDEGKADIDIEGPGNRGTEKERFHGRLQSGTPPIDPMGADREMPLVNCGPPMGERSIG